MGRSSHQITKQDASFGQQPCWVPRVCSTYVRQNVGAEGYWLFNWLSVGESGGYFPPWDLFSKYYKEAPLSHFGGFKFATFLA